MQSPNNSLLCCALPDRVAPHVDLSPLSSFLVIWSPSGDTRGPSVVFEAVDMPCPVPFHFSHIADYIYDFCPLPDPEVCVSILVSYVEYTSFQFGMCVGPCSLISETPLCVAYSCADYVCGIYNIGLH